MSDQNVLWPKEGRRQPIMVGRDASGRPLPGGPYTLYQLGAVLVVFVAGYTTRTLWAPGQSIIAQLIYLIGAAFGAAFLAGRIDFISSNPVWSVTGWVKALTGAFTHPAGELCLPRTRPAWKPETTETTSARTIQIQPLPEPDAQQIEPQTPTLQPAPEPTTPTRSRPTRPNRERRRLRLRKAPKPVPARVPAVPSATAEQESARPDVAVAAPATETLPISAIPVPQIRRSSLESFLAAADRSR